MFLVTGFKFQANYGVRQLTFFGCTTKLAKGSTWAIWYMHRILWTLIVRYTFAITVNLTNTCWNLNISQRSNHSIFTKFWPPAFSGIFDYIWSQAHKLQLRKTSCSDHVFEKLSISIASWVSLKAFAVNCYLSILGVSGDGIQIIYMKWYIRSLGTQQSSPLIVHGQSAFCQVSSGHLSPAVHFPSHLCSQSLSVSKGSTICWFWHKTSYSNFGS